MRSAAPRATVAGMASYLMHDEPVLIWTGGTMLDGRLTVPREAHGVVLLAGLMRTWSEPALRAFATRLHVAGFGTLLADLLTPEEQQIDARTGHLRLDTQFLSERITDVTRWLAQSGQTREIPVAILGNDDTSAAALLAAATGVPFFAVIVHGAIEPDSFDVPVLSLDDVTSYAVVEWLKSHAPSFTFA